MLEQPWIAHRLNPIGEQHFALRAGPIARTDLNRDVDILRTKSTGPKPVTMRTLVPGCSSLNSDSRGISKSNRESRRNPNIERRTVLRARDAVGHRSDDFEGGCDAAVIFFAGFGQDIAFARPMKQAHIEKGFKGRDLPAYGRRRHAENIGGFGEAADAAATSNTCNGLRGGTDQAKTLSSLTKTQPSLPITNLPAQVKWAKGSTASTLPTFDRPRCSC